MFNNFSNISWRSVLLVEETGVPGENHRPAACESRCYRRVSSSCTTVEFRKLCIPFIHSSLSHFIMKNKNGSAVMVNNSNNINNMKTHLLSHPIEHKKLRHIALKIQVLPLNRHTNVAVLNRLIEFQPLLIVKSHTLQT